MAFAPFYAFQSHNGAIAADGTLDKALQKIEFQSHNGAIAADKEYQDRFKKLLFQSHNGAIAARLRCVTQNVF